MNETKTRVCRLPEETFDFLGYTFGRCYSPQDGPGLSWGTSVEEEDQAALRRDQRDAPTRQHVHQDVAELVARPQPQADGLGELLPPGTGQQSLPRRGLTTPAIGSVSGCAGKHKVQGVGTSRFPDEYLYEELGLVRLRR